MRDSGRGLARDFYRLLVVLWVMLAGDAVWRIYRWDSATPFITEDLLEGWALRSLLLGVFGSVASCWEVTAEKNPWRLSDIRQMFEWSAVQLLYFATSIVFYIGVLVGVLFAIDATIYRYFELLGRNNDVAFFSPGVFPYIVVITFLAVAFSSTLVVGRPFARWIITETESRWNRRDTNRPSTE